MECENKILGIWFGNRVAEVQNHMADWVKQGIKVEPLYHWPGTDNIADIATKGEATVKDIVSGSAWQRGPDALRLGREHWPASREFTRTIPEEERSPNYASHVTGGIPLTSLSNLVTTVSELMTYSNNLRKVVAILARVMAAQTEGERLAIVETPSLKRICLARHLLFIVESYEVSSEVEKKMTTLAPRFKEGVWVTRGRLGKGLPNILGVEKLPILLSSSRLAGLIMIEAHRENHDGAPGTLA